MPTRGGARRANKRIEITTTRHPMVTTTTVERPAIVDVEKRPQCRFWLVQRFEPASHPHERGLSRYFDCEYMGSTEFEVGKGAESLRRIRAQEFVMVPYEMTYQGITQLVYFVGPAEGLEAKAADFQGWLDRDLPSKEWTSFDRLFTEQYLFDRKPRTAAWHSLDDDILWTLDYALGELLLKGLANKS